MTIRQRVVEAFIERFGEPEKGPDPAGVLYRWRLKRKNWLDVHIIIDSPELESQAHILISDPCPDMPAIRSQFVREGHDLNGVLDDIEAQWQMRNCWAVEAGTPSEWAQEHR